MKHASGLSHNKPSLIGLVSREPAAYRVYIDFGHKQICRGRLLDSIPYYSFVEFETTFGSLGPLLTTNPPNSGGVSMDLVKNRPLLATFEENGSH